MAQRGSLRASDADREQVAERLRQATAEGRLVAHELEQRLATALRARTYGELDSVVADLPGRRLPQRERQRSSAMTVARPLLALAIVVPLLMAVVFVITGVVAVWMLWAVLGWWFFGHRHGFGTCARSGHGGGWEAGRSRAGRDSWN